MLLLNLWEQLRIIEGAHTCLLNMQKFIIFTEAIELDVIGISH